ncbi:hypothetical protein O3P69_000243 [Scylla paramamosain]|uniref:Aminotransferase class I/classII large domain-containing protein n=1 Tax=Scylla paramamosain TaxID=85552 RepID=A0AAW0UV72_SCYPA
MSREKSSLASLSERGVRTAACRNFIYHKMLDIHSNSYHPEKNPKGIVNLGIAVNCLMEEEICQRLNKGDAFHIMAHHIHYFKVSGIDELREAVADFLNRHFKPLEPITSAKMSIMCGATGCLDGLAHILCDSGDIVITPTPVYDRIPSDFLDVANVKEDSEGRTFNLQPEALERRINELRAQDRRVRAFLLISPQNPLGEVYSPVLLKQLLDVCARNEIHFIVDEIYGLSVHDGNKEFRSVLSLDLPDPMRTHVIWAMSKDFGLAGLRMGVVLSECPGVHEFFHKACFFRNIPWIVQHAAATLLKDTVWCDEFYLPTYWRRLAHNYQITCDRLEAMGVRVRRGSAGLFIWFSVKSFLRPVTMEEESVLMQEIFDGGLYITQGKILCCTSPGWMRLVFTVTEKELDEGLDRLRVVLAARKLRLAMKEP